MFNFFRKKGEAELLPLPYTTDLHCHIIPGVDDGSRDLEMSLFLVGKMKEWGITSIIATPHRTDETFENTPDTISAPFHALKQAIEERGLGIELTHSFEYRMDEGFIRLKEEGKLIPLKNNYILVENSFMQPLWNLDELIFDLKLKGFKPILAHPERYSYYFGNKKRYTEIHDAECDFQINILSLAGTYGKDVQNAAMWMLEQGYVDFIGTDLHHPAHAKAISEFLRSKQYKKLRPKLNVKNDWI
ncbi:MAG: CpsB/CapC family capsule biosynthesis tyrosine phosphatase [Bacteroidales bacterium]